MGLMVKSLHGFRGALVVQSKEVDVLAYLQGGAQPQLQRHQEVVVFN